MIEVSYAEYQMETWEEVSTYLEKLSHIKGSSEDEVVSPKKALVLANEFASKIKELGYIIPALTWAADGEVIFYFYWPTRQDNEQANVCFLADGHVVAYISVTDKPLYTLDASVIPSSLYEALSFLKET